VVAASQQLPRQLQQLLLLLRPAWLPFLRPPHHQRSRCCLLALLLLMLMLPQLW
jgi:hypothetical protein